MSNAFSRDRYQAWLYEARGPYRWQVIDTEWDAHGKRNKIVARTASEETAVIIAKQLNEKGHVEEI